MIQRWQYLELRITPDPDPPPPPARPIWRLTIYRGGGAEPEERTDHRLIDVLNELGLEGWELITARTMGSVAFPSRQDPYRPAESYEQGRSLIFKRRLVES